VREASPAKKEEEKKEEEKKEAPLMLNTNSSKGLLPSGSATSLASKASLHNVPKVVLKRFGIGWSLIKLFGQGLQASGSVKLYQGTPRILLSADRA
jgi:hypothetical protein